MLQPTPLCEPVRAETYYHMRAWQRLIPEKNVLASYYYKVREQQPAPVDPIGFALLPYDHFAKLFNGFKPIILFITYLHQNE